MAPKVSIVTPLYNSSQVIEQTLDSVLAQTVPDWEVILIDDGSTDDTAVKIAPYLDDPRFSYTKQTNRGIAAARNSAIRKATGEWICLLDHDDRWLPTKLARQLEFAARDSLDLLGTDAFVFAGEPSGEPRLYSEVFLARVQPRLHRFTPETDTTALLLDCNFLCSSSVMIRRTLFDQLGLLSETAAPADDYDMWLRCAPVARIGYLNEPLIEYWLHEGNFSRDFMMMLDKEIQALATNRHLFTGNKTYLGIIDQRIRDLSDQLTTHRQVAARSRLDDYHRVASEGSLSQALPRLRESVQLAPAEVFRPRRMAAILKRALSSILRRTDATAKPGLK